MNSDGAVGHVRFADVKCPISVDQRSTVCFQAWNSTLVLMTPVRRRFGRAEVIYEALQHQLFTKEAPLLDIVLPCLLKVLGVVEHTTGTSEVTFKENR